MTSSDNDRKMSNLTSRSCRTQVFRSSSKVGCGVLDALGEPELDAVLGMGIGREPSQKPQEPLVSQANLSPLRHLEYSGPVAHACRIGRPGRRGELSVDILLNKKAAAALRREAGWSGGEQRDMSSSMATKTSRTCAHACWPRSRLYHMPAHTLRRPNCERVVGQPPPRASPALPASPASHEQQELALILQGPLDARFPERRGLLLCCLPCLVVPDGCVPQKDLLRVESAVRGRGGGLKRQSLGGC